METRVCKNCSQPFSLEPDDLSFYERISVPPPTWCPECRLIRRLVWRNERVLYWRTCDLCKKKIFSVYDSAALFPVYCPGCWWGDAWDAMEFGQEYDESKSFFEQYAALAQKVPKMASYQLNCINSPYANLLGNSKEVYLSYSITKSEEIFFSRVVDDSFRVFDSLHCGWLQNSYWSIYTGRSNAVHFSFRSQDCLDSWFLFDCGNCQNCFMSSNLRNKRYVFRNEQLAKEEYFKKLSKERIGELEMLEKLKQEFQELAKNAIHRFAWMFNTVNSTGNMLLNAKNCRDAYEGHDLEDSRYIIRAHYAKDSYDVCFNIHPERFYEYINGGQNNADLQFCTDMMDNVHHAAYSQTCNGSSNLFGCIGLRGKQYCILNKQYARDEYLELISNIKLQMTKADEYGEFFPMRLSPFSYNETIAQEYFPLSKNEVLAKGYRWKDPEHKELLANDSDLVRCEHSGKCNELCTLAFRTIPAELEFYKKIGVPVPRLCPNCRHYERIKMKLPYKLWHRKCSNCDNEFESSYAPERPEKVFCEFCYQRAVL